MSLRVRLFVTSLLIALPLALALFLVDERVRLGFMEDDLRRSVDYDVSSGLHARCEAAPPTQGRPGRGVGRGPEPRAPGQRPRRPGYDFFAYDAQGRPSAADAPPLPPDRSGDSATRFWSGPGRGVQLVVPLAADGPCAFVVARVNPNFGALRDQAVALGLVVFSVLAAAWFTAGPLIARLRRLQDSVQRSAASHYAVPVVVEGHDEVATLAGAFNDAGLQVRTHVMEVQAREASLRDFVANTTHDVAIPLTVLQGHLDELARSTGSAPTAPEHVRAAIHEAHYMASLLRNLGAATRLDETGTSVVFSPVDLSALVERVVTRHRPMARAFGVELNFAVPDPPLTVDTDVTLLEQALSNLMDNAVRYNHAGGHVAVVLDRAGSEFLLSVTDDGPGVSDEELAQLTTRRFRGALARTRRPDGKGLGLAIVTESVARLGVSLAFHRTGSAGLRAAIRGSLQTFARNAD